MVRRRLYWIPRGTALHVYLNLNMPLTKCSAMKTTTGRQKSSGIRNGNKKQNKKRKATGRRLAWKLCQ